MVVKMGDLFIALGLHWDMPCQMCLAPVSSPLEMRVSLPKCCQFWRFALGLPLTAYAATYYQRVARCAPARAALSHSSQSRPRIAPIAV